VSYAVNELPGYIDNSVDGRDDINDAKQTSARAALRWQEDSFSLDLVAMRQTIDSDNNAQVALDPVSQEPQFGDLTNSVWVDEPFTKDVDFYSATLNWNLGWADFVSATGYSESSSLFRQDATVQFGQVANLLLHLPAPGASNFDISLDMDKFTQEFRLVSHADGPVRVDGRRVLHQGRRHPDPVRPALPARRLAVAAAVRQHRRHPGVDYDSERLQGNGGLRQRFLPVQ
jgi:hypothetical protein